MSDTETSILIIDDEPPLLRMMSLYLGRKGYRVTVAGSAPKARAELAAAPGGYAAVVLDATVPGGSPSDLGSEILRTDSSVRILVASGYPVDVSALEAASPGRVAFLHKPFSPEMLANAVRSLLATEEKSV